MRIDVDRAIWVVVVPGPTSELGDVCFQTSIAKLALQVRGGLDVEERHATMYLAAAEALRDANLRLKARHAYERALREVRP